MVSFSHYQTLDPSAYQVSRELFDRADREPPSMMAFIFRWMGFNGWMAAVTGCERDYEMINALAAELRMIATYDQLLADRPDFKVEVDAFSAKWPVLNVAHVRAKLGFDAFRRYDRAALLVECDAQQVKRQPMDGWRALRQAGNSCCAQSIKSGATCSTAKNRSKLRATAISFSRPTGSEAIPGRNGLPRME
jgi:hypothetical protein